MLSARGIRAGRPFLLFVPEASSATAFPDETAEVFAESAARCGSAIPHYMLTGGIEGAHLVRAIEDDLQRRIETPAVLLMDPHGEVLDAAVGKALTPARLDSFIGGREFTVDARRLADHLVAGSRVPIEIVVREMLQNAVDATERAGIHRADSPSEIQFDYALGESGAFVLSIADRGIGMTESDVYEKLLRVARSGTAESGIVGRGDRQRGFYGVGFLTALTVSSLVRVRTQSLHTGEPAVEWFWSRAGQQGAVRLPGRPGAHGTRIELQLQPEVSEHLTADRIRRVITHVARYVPIPVYFGESMQRCNDPLPPWELDHTDEAALQAICRERGENRPIHIMMLTRSSGLPFRGLLFVPSHHEAEYVRSSEKAHAEQVDLYVGGILVQALDRDFLGPFEGLVGGILCDDQLSPKLLRDALIANDTWEEHRERLRAHLEKEFAQLFSERPAAFVAMRQAFPRRTDELLRDSALLREATGDHYYYSTSVGNRTFDQLAHKVFRGKPIVLSLPFARHTLVNLVLRSNNVDYVNLDRMEDLELFADRCHDKGKRLVLSTDALAELVEESVVRPYPRLLDTLERVGVMSVFVDLEPASLPMFAFRLEQQWRLAVNVRCPEIRTLEAHRNTAVRDYVLTDLITMSLLLSGRNVEPDEQIVLIELKLSKLGEFLERFAGRR